MRSASFGLLTESEDPARAWSGTVGSIVDALRGIGHSVRLLDPVLPRITRAATLMEGAQRRMTEHGVAITRSAAMAWMKARAIERMLARHPEVEVLLAPVASTLLPYLRTDLPVVYVSDATLPLLERYYARQVRLSDAAHARAVAMEGRAVRKASVAAYPTRWAAASARADFGIPEDRLLVAPFGPNLMTLPDRATALAPRAPGPPRLLFCAVEWERKGGDLLLGAARLLEERGLAVEVSVMGVAPPAGTRVPGNVAVLDRLDKNDPAQAARFADVFAQADLFVLPTRADCFGMVFCEAAAFGVPSLSARTGGVPEVVLDGRTGRLLEPEAGPEGYADAIAALAGDPERLAAMGRAARDDFETRLNWEAWARAVTARLEALRPLEAVATPSAGATPTSADGVGADSLEPRAGTGT